MNLRVLFGTVKNIILNQYQFRKQCKLSSDEIERYICFGGSEI